mgnify:CR=1 FL=1
MTSSQRKDLRAYITPYRIANDIRILKKRNKNRAFLIVEGEDDAKVYGEFVNKEQCTLQVAHSKDVAIGAIQELDKTNTSGVLAIVDADYEKLQGNAVVNPNIVYTDTHDLETMILSSPALEKVLVSFLPDVSISMVQKLGEQVRSHILDIGTHIGCVRWINFRNKLSLDFKDLPYERFINKDNIQVDLSELISILNVGRNRLVYEEDILKECNQLRANNPDQWHVCQGHDLVNLLKIVVPFCLADFLNPNLLSLAIKKCKLFRFDDELYSEYEETFFIQTDLYKEIKSWEVRNVPFLILRIV